jgi:hypothetical protein
MTVSRISQLTTRLPGRTAGTALLGGSEHATTHR